jgi:hypothetical protein
MPLRTLTTIASARYGALRYGALPELGDARASVLSSMWFAKIDSINTVLSVTPRIASIVQAQSNISAVIALSPRVAATVQTLSSISATLSVTPRVAASVQTQTSISATLSLTPRIAASVQAQSNISAVLSVSPSLVANVSDGQLFLTFETPDNRLVQLGFTARYTNQEVWRFVGITSGPRFT